MEAMENPEHLRADRSDQAVILLAEDDVLVENIVRITLERDGHFVLTSQNGEEALLLSRKYPGEIHLLLSDIDMPRMNGVDLARRVSAERPGICVLLTSGYFNGPVQDYNFLPKPFRPD